VDKYLAEGERNMSAYAKNREQKSCLSRKAALHSRRQTSRKTVKVRFLADANFNRKIIAGVLRREARINFLSGAEVDLTGIPDLQVLPLAASEGRVVLTHDVGRWSAHSRSHVSWAQWWRAFGGAERAGRTSY